MPALAHSKPKMTPALETASPSAGFSYDACRLGVSCRLAQGRRLGDSCLKAVNGQDEAHLMHSSCW